MQSLWESPEVLTALTHSVCDTFLFPSFIDVQTHQKEHGEKRKKTLKEQRAAPFSAPTTLTYILDTEDFSNRSWLADIHTKKKESGHKLYVSGL